MKYVKKVVGVLSILFALLFLVNLLSNQMLVKGFESLIYYNKSEISYVEKTFDVTVDEFYKLGKSYTYHCSKKDEAVLSYIILDYRSKSFGIFDYNQGINREQAKEIAKENGFQPGQQEPELCLYNASQLDERNLVWLVYNDDNQSIHLYFTDGRLTAESIGKIG